MAACGRLTDKARRSEYHKTSAEDKVFKGARHLLLKRRLKKRKEREHPKELLGHNKTLLHLYVHRHMLRHIWAYRHRLGAARTVIEWCRLARADGHPELHRFADTLQRLEAALELNQPLVLAYYMTEDLCKFWNQGDRRRAEAFLED